MTSNVALDVFIGLVFVYLLYSLLATVVQETIASFLNLRAVVLVKAIRIMLNDRKPVALQSTSLVGKTVERIINTFKMQLQNIACRLPDFTLAKAFYKHPSIKYLSPNTSRSKPSYIEPKNFSSTLIQILRGKDYDGSVPVMLSVYNTLYPMLTAARQNTDITTVETGKVNPVVAVIQPETLDKLRQLFIDSGKDLNTFTSLLEDWYNEMMDRANGWYKRQVRRILFFIGLGIAIGGNVDTIKIYHVLSKDKGARDQMVQMAIQSQQKYGAAINELRDTTGRNKNASDTQKVVIITTGDSLLNTTYNEVKNDIDQSNNVMAMGWHSSAKYKLYDSLSRKQKQITDSLKGETTKDTSLQNQLNQVDKNIAALAPLVYDKFDWSSSPLGWLLTAMAMTLGAPFWFDLLSKFISLRAAGTKPVSTPADDSVNPMPDSVSPTEIPVSITPSEAKTATDNQHLIVRDEAADSTIAQG